MATFYNDYLGNVTVFYSSSSSGNMRMTRLQEISNGYDAVSGIIYSTVQFRITSASMPSAVSCMLSTAVH